MTFEKMHRILTFLRESGIEHGDVGISAGGELALEPVEQPPQHVHLLLRRRGFVLGGDPMNRYSYVYRPARYPRKPVKRGRVGLHVVQGGKG